MLPDYELTSWYLSNNPESHFVTTLIAARTQPQRRYALRNSQLTVHEMNRESVTRSLRSAAELREVLRETFGIAVPESAEVDERLAQMVSG